MVADKRRMEDRSEGRSHSDAFVLFLGGRVSYLVCYMLPEYYFLVFGLWEDKKSNKRVKSSYLYG